DGIRDFHVTGVQTCALPIFQICKVDPITAIAILEVIGRHTATAMSDRIKKMVVYRRLDDDFVAFPGKRPYGCSHCGNHARGGQYPSGLDGEAVPAVPPMGDGVVKSSGGAGIAEDAVLDTGMQRLDHHRGSRKIHIGDPHRQYFPIRGTPFDGVRAAAVDRLVEVKGLHLVMHTAKITFIGDNIREKRREMRPAQCPFSDCTEQSFFLSDVKETYVYY